VEKKRLNIVYFWNYSIYNYINNKRLIETVCVKRKEKIMTHNIYDQMVAEWDSYEDNWIIKMQAEGLVKPDLSEKEYDQLFNLLTYGEW
tara:strand:- start:41 stop:307 length:267 start_codon:yes stop_codon:yes gene_type:complete